MIWPVGFSLRIRRRTIWVAGDIRLVCFSALAFCRFLDLRPTLRDWIMLLGEADEL